MVSDPLNLPDPLALRLRPLVPAELWAGLCRDRTAPTLMAVFEHLRTLQHILSDYMPRRVTESLARAESDRIQWQEGTLLFTDLAGFTPLLEANAAQGTQGAAALLDVLNRYFSEMLEILSKSGGDLLEFTGDAMLVQFLSDMPGHASSCDLQRADVAQAIRAGLRMQRAMGRFATIQTSGQDFSLGMRVGLHSGSFLATDLGVQRRAHVLLGKTVQQAKQVESKGMVGRVCLGDRTFIPFEVEPAEPGFWLVNDTLTADELGEYDISLHRRRQSTRVLFDRSPEALRREIEHILNQVEHLARYLPGPLLKLVVEHTAQRQVPPSFATCAVLFINVLGLTESVDDASPEAIAQILERFSHIFSAVDAIAQREGGILQKVTYQLVGSDMLLYFGLFDPTVEARRQAVETAIAAREAIAQLGSLVLGERVAEIQCRMGLAYGSVFAAEIGEVRGRREFNILGDPVNTASRLMSSAAPGQILMTDAVHQAIAPHAAGYRLGTLSLKGKSQPVEVIGL